MYWPVSEDPHLGRGAPSLKDIMDGRTVAKTSKKKGVGSQKKVAKKVKITSSTASSIPSSAPTLSAISTSSISVATSAVDPATVSAATQLLIDILQVVHELTHSSILSSQVIIALLFSNKFKRIRQLSVPMHFLLPRISLLLILKG